MKAIRIFKADRCRCRVRRHLVGSLAALMGWTAVANGIESQADDGAAVADVAGFDACHSVAAPFVPIAVHEESRTLLVAGREIRLSSLGFPESCRSYFNAERTHLMERPIELLKGEVCFRPFHFVDIWWCPKEFRFLEKTANHVAWKAVMTLGDAQFVLWGEIDCAGHMKFRVEASYLSNLRLCIDFAKEGALEFEGLGHRKGTCPTEAIRWRWRDGAQKSVSCWFGSARGGCRVTFHDEYAGTGMATLGPGQNGGGSFIGVSRGVSIVKRNTPTAAADAKAKGTLPFSIAFDMDMTPCLSQEIGVPVSETREWVARRLAMLQKFADLERARGLKDALSAEPTVDLGIGRTNVEGRNRSDVTIACGNGLRMVSRDSEEPCRHCVDEIWLGESLLGALDAAPIILEDGGAVVRDAYLSKLFNPVWLRNYAAKVMVDIDPGAKFGFGIMTTESRGRAIATVTSYHGKGRLVGFLLRFHPNPKTFAGFDGGVTRFSDGASLRLSTESTLAAPARLVERTAGACVEFSFDFPEPLERPDGSDLWFETTPLGNQLYLVLEARDRSSVEPEPVQDGGAQRFPVWSSIDFKDRKGVLKGDHGERLDMAKDRRGRIVVGRLMCFKREGDDIAEEVFFNAWSNGRMYGYPPLEYLKVPARVDGVKIDAIASYGLAESHSLKEVVIENGVSIDDHAFFKDVNLRSVRLPDDLREIADGMFMDCASLKAVNIPEGVTRIGGRAFCASGIQHIVIPDSVRTIADRAFERCEKLCTVSLPAGTKLEGGDSGVFRMCDRFRMKIEWREP